MSRIGGKILELKKVYKSYGDLVILKDLTTPLKKVNASELLEKTVLEKYISKYYYTKKNADSGKINTGETIVYGYFSQKNTA